MDGNHEDDCRYCEQDRNGGWIYCRSCGRLLSQSRVAATRTNGTAQAGSTASASAGGASGA